jgi:hypothetical protein
VVRGIGKERALQGDAIIADSNIRGKQLSRDLNTADTGVYNVLAGRASGVPNPASGVGSNQQTQFNPGAAVNSAVYAGHLTNSGFTGAGKNFDAGATRVGGVNPFASIDDATSYGARSLLGALEKRNKPISARPNDWAYNNAPG